MLIGSYYVNMHSINAQDHSARQLIAVEVVACISLRVVIVTVKLVVMAMTLVTFVDVVTCLIGGSTPALWEDITGTTPLTFVNDCVSFTLTVSARYKSMSLLLSVNCTTYIKHCCCQAFMHD